MKLHVPVFALSLVSYLSCEAFTVLPNVKVVCSDTRKPLRPTTPCDDHDQYSGQIFLRMTLVSPDMEEETDTYNFDKEVEETNALIIDFVHRVDETPVGKLDEEDFEFIQPILRELVSLSEKGVGIDGDVVMVAEMVEKLVGRLVDEWKFAIINDVDMDFEPDVALFNMAMNAWNEANSRDIHAMVNGRVTLLFEEINEFHDNGLASCKPDTISFNNLLRMIAFGKRKGSDDVAIEKYQEMKELGVMPNAETFELLIDILAKSRERNSASRADEVLRQGVARFPPKKGGIGIESFNAVLAAWVS